jgi:hypothetical protein
VVELAADHRRDLRHFLGHGQAVEAGHEGILQRRGDHQRRQRPRELVPALPLGEEAGLEPRLGQLLHEQRHAVSPGQDLLQHLGRQGATPGHLVDHRAALPPREPAERERGDVPVPGPGRGELRAEGDHGQHRQALRPLDHAADQLERGWVRPVHVLVERQHRLAGGQPGELLQQRPEGTLLLLLRAQLRRGVAVTARDAEQVGEQG